MAGLDIRNTILSAIRLYLGDDAEKPGAVLYNGLDTLCSNNGLYIMGFNPGGDPNTITTSVIKSLEVLKDQYCSYRDECWRKACPEDCKKHQGKSRHQERVCSLVQVLRRDISETVAVNTVFLRSKKQDDLKASWDIFEKCWHVHEKLLSIVRPKIILCLGNGEPRSAFAFLRKKVSPTTQPSSDHVKSFVSEIVQCPVIGVRHPSYPWFDPVTDLKSFLEKNHGLAKL